MLKVWGKLWQRGHMKESITVMDGHLDWPLEKRVLHCEEEITMQLDLARPIWLPSNRKELADFGSTKFTQDNFVEAFPYQSLELEIIGTDEDDEDQG